MHVLEVNFPHQKELAVLNVVLVDKSFGVLMLFRYALSVCVCVCACMSMLCVCA